MYLSSECYSLMFLSVYLSFVELSDEYLLVAYIYSCHV